MTDTEPEDPTPRACLDITHQAAGLATEAADHALNTLIRSRARNPTRLEQTADDTYREATEAARYAALADQWAADPHTPLNALRNCALKAIHHAVIAQQTAGISPTAAQLHAAVERQHTAQERAEQENIRRRVEAEVEAAERAATGMDSDNRHLTRMNTYLAQSNVPALGWSTGHLRVMEAASTGRLYTRDGQTRQAPTHGVWNGGRRIHHERTQHLHTAGFLTTTTTRDNTQLLTLTPMGQVALELARLHPDGIYTNDTAAYEARFARVPKRYKSNDERKAAARCLPALPHSALRLYQRPVTLAEQETRADREATERWDDEGGHCPGVPTPTAHLPAAEPALPPGMHLLPLPSQHHTWWALHCAQCQDGIHPGLPGEWDDEHAAAQAARRHYDHAHRPTDDPLTPEETAEANHWPLSAAQRTVLHHAAHTRLTQDHTGFWTNPTPDHQNTTTPQPPAHVTELWAAGLLNILDDYGPRRLVPSPTGHHITQLLARAHRQGAIQPPPDHARLTPLPERSGNYPPLPQQHRDH